MRKIIVVSLLFQSALLFAQSHPPTTLRGVLIEQLRTTHDQKDWFVPISVSLDGLTPEQAKWTDRSGNHSIGQLANHLLFWNTRALATFKGEKSAPFDGNNDETFNSFDSKSWNATVQKLNQVMVEWEKAVQEASDAKLGESASVIAHIGTHNAYHIGQIVYIRKLQGSWNPSKGVK